MSPRRPTRTARSGTAPSWAPAATYSIVARDPTAGSMGAAVQSHWFSVGSLVPHVRPGAGVVVTQSFVEPGMGQVALELLAGRRGAAETVAELLATDESAGFRQLAVLGVDGEAPAAYTGPDCIPDAGHAVASDASCQANLMATRQVWDAMLEGFEAAGGDLADRLLSALVAGEGAGGDVRGRQSAALIVAPIEGAAWERAVDLRVEDHPQPLDELGRLLRLARAYEAADEADSLSAAGRGSDAARRYRDAAAIAPEQEELRFWAGLGLVAAGEVDRGIEEVSAAIEIHEGWATLLLRLDPDAFPAAEQVARRLGLIDRD